MARKPGKVAKKWIRTEADREAIRLGYWFDTAAAAKVCQFFERFLRHSKGSNFAKTAFILEPWQRDWLSRLFGWKRPDGFRRYREAYLEIPKKNGKSTLVSGLCLYGLIEEPGAEVYTGAVDRGQAGIVFGEAAKMVRASPDLARHIAIKDSKNRMILAANNAKLEAMSADVDSKDGVNSSLCTLDEVHRFKSDALYEIMQYAGAARQQPLLVSITTAGTNRHSLCYRLHEQARRIEEGAIEDLEFLGVIYAADPEKDDLDDPATWRKANPSMGRIISEEDFAKEYRKAKRLPRTLNHFLRLRLNVWTEQSVRWLSVDRWDKLAEPPDAEPLEGTRCHAALDLSSVADLTSLTLCFPDGDRFRFRSFYFVPEETADTRSEFDRVPYPKWGADGHLDLTPGNATDHGAIRQKLLDLAELYEIASVGMDPWNAQQLANQLVEDGFNVVMMRQGFATLSSPSKELERLLLSGRLSHEGNPVTHWCVGNVAVETDPAGNIKPSKKKSTERIDGVASMVMALALAMGPEAPLAQVLAL